jgi:hypothetical protein
LKDAQDKFIHKIKVRFDSEGNGDGGLIPVKSRRCYLLQPCVTAFVGNVEKPRERRDGYQKMFRVLDVTLKGIQLLLSCQNYRKIEAAMASKTTMAMFSLEGQTALVTGGTRGIGQAVAVALAEAGADVILIQVCMMSSIVGVNTLPILKTNGSISVICPTQ